MNKQQRVGETQMAEVAAQTSQTTSKQRGGGGKAERASVKKGNPQHTAGRIAQEPALPLSPVALPPALESAAVIHAHAFTIAYPSLSKARSEALRALYSELHEVSQALVYTSSYVKKAPLGGLIERQVALKDAIRRELERVSAVRGL